MLGACLVYRKQLLNKCQEEFEKGAVAMKGVETQAKAELGSTKEQKEPDQVEVRLPGLTAFPCDYVHSALAYLVSCTSCVAGHM